MLLTTVPQCPPVSIGKVVSLLSSQQCNAATFRDIAATLLSVMTLLRTDSPMLPHLLALTSHDSGINTTQSQLLLQVEQAFELIRNTVSLREELVDDDSAAASHSKDVPFEDTFLRIPSEFFVRNEIEFRGSINAGR